MLRIRRAEERGRTEWGWLDSRHTFAFGDYYDSAHVGFRALRVINDDLVEPGAGFGAHSHRDMEILSYVLEGALEHEDSSGGGGVIRPGEIQLMRAGTGVTHSEYNHSRAEPVHFLQIWILPDTEGLPPAYAQRSFDREAAARDFLLLVSPDARDGSLPIRQDVDVWAGVIGAAESRDFRIRKGRHAWLHVARGSVSVDGNRLQEGDGAAVTGQDRLRMEGNGESAEVLLFDLA
jgi:redox-sensitive bicupin YhaK (pirin superfamily)